MWKLKVIPIYLALGRSSGSKKPKVTKQPFSTSHVLSHCCCSMKLITWQGGLQACHVPWWHKHMPPQVCSKYYRCCRCCFLGPLQNVMSVGSVSYWVMRYTIPLLSNISYLYFRENSIFHRDLRVHQTPILCFAHLETRIEENWSTFSKCHIRQKYMWGSRHTHPRAPESYFCAIFTKTASLLRKVQLLQLLSWSSIRQPYDITSLAGSCMATSPVLFQYLGQKYFMVISGCNLKARTSCICFLMCTCTYSGGLKGTYAFNLLDNANLFRKVLYQVTFSPTVLEFLTLRDHSYITVALICTPLETEEVEHLFVWLVIWIASFIETTPLTAYL